MINLLIAFLHFIVGPDYHGPFKSFGSTLDPVDYLMYATGIALGIIIDVFLEKYIEVNTSVD